MPRPKKDTDPATPGGLDLTNLIAELREDRARLDDTIRAFERIAAGQTKTNRRLIIAGAGAYESNLRQLAEPYPRIEFLGRVQHGKLGELYGGARATILPSLCYETFGLTVLESLTQGTPAIVSRRGAPRELIAETGGGATYSDLSEFKAIIDAWDSDPGIPQGLGRNGSQHLGKYRASLHLESYLALIESCRTGPRAAGKPLGQWPARRRDIAVGR